LLKVSFPQLFSFAKNENITVKSILELESFDEHFRLPMSEIAFEQFCDLSVILQNLPESNDNDKWSLIWGNELFSINKAYQHLIGDEYVHPALRWI
jgi:hypothetical protein